MTARFPTPPSSRIEVAPVGPNHGSLSTVGGVTLTDDREASGAPAAVVVKLEPDDGTMRKFGDELHAFEREIHFYREVAPDAPIRLARLYFATTDPPDFAMVMEVSRASRWVRHLAPHNEGLGIVPPAVGQSEAEPVSRVRQRRTRRSRPSRQGPVHLCRFLPTARAGDAVGDRIASRHGPGVPLRRSFGAQQRPARLVGLDHLGRE